jgi:CRISPR-associated protein Csx17
MTHATPPLSVIRLAGLHLDTLGHYFAALGLLRTSARQWYSVKGCWREGVFHLVGGPQNFTELETFLLDIGSNNKWTQYTRGWLDKQKKDTKDKTARNLALWKAAEASEVEAVFMLSHVTIGEKRSLNPVFGNGGSSGNRDFSKGWGKARDAVNAVAPKAKKGKKKTVTDEMPSLLPAEMPPAAKQDLPAFLNGETCSFLSDYGAACWFSDANKKYNFSPDKPFREGQITPWAMLLACEAFPLLVGATSRQIGSAREGTGAFPFVTAGTAPENEKEVETLIGEFWAPIWKRPLSVAEVSALYKRGRAEVNGRGAITSVAFAAAIIQRGTDAGLAEFRRFSLLHTTSAQTFESRLASVHPLETGTADVEQAEAVAKIIRFRDALPRESREGESWVYRGLQGPIDNALVRLAAAGKDELLRVEYSWALLDAVFASLEKTANNKTFRKSEPELELLQPQWAVLLLKKTKNSTPELRIALTLATLCAERPKKTDSESEFDNIRNLPAPLLAYRVGVVPVWKNEWGKVKVAEPPPLRVAWSRRGLVDNLCAVIQRRIAVESNASDAPPTRTQFTLSTADVSAFINNETDDALIERWLIRFMLFDWSFAKKKSEVEEEIKKKSYKELRDLLKIPPEKSQPPESALQLLYAWFRPLFHAYTFSQLDAVKTGKEENAVLEKKGPTAGMLRPLVALFVRGDTAAAHRAATNRYKSLFIETADFGTNAFTFISADSRRLLAALLLPLSPKSVAKTFSRWRLSSGNNNSDNHHITFSSQPPKHQTKGLSQ